VAAQRQAQREAEERERALLAEAGFRLLLAGQEAAIKAGATWAQVKRNMWADPRCAGWGGERVTWRVGGGRACTFVLGVE